jgi:hypothetical protein
MAFVIREAFINLGPGDVWKAAADDCVNGFAALHPADDIMDTHPGALDDGVAAADTGLAQNVMYL